MKSNSNHNTTTVIQWRRNKVLELSSQGNNQSEISRILQISVATVNRDISLLRDSNQNKTSENTLTKGCQKSTRNA
jgi:transcriptional regulator